MRGVAVAAVAVSFSVLLAAVAACGSPGMMPFVVGTPGQASVSGGDRPRPASGPGRDRSAREQLETGQALPGGDQSARQQLETGQALRGPAGLPAPGATPAANADAEPLRVGALFAGGNHYCTASVVDSPRHDVLITAAHCIYPANGHGYMKHVTFVPGYADGRRPYGTWRPERLIVDRTWTTDSDPELDVGFVVLRPQHGKNIQDVLGGDQLGVDPGFTRLVRVTGYPSAAQTPVTCVNWTSQQNSTQLRFACSGFYGGTSGSPWVTDFDPATATGTIVGVIGGFEEGGNTDSVSYSAYFSKTVWRLYQEASA